MSIADLPRGVRALLAAALPEDWRADIVRDLEEAWSDRRATDGAMRARLWLWGQALAFAIRFAPERARSLASAAPSPSVDLRLALRSVRKAPFVTGLAVVALGIGIGASVGGYTFTKGTLFTDLPYPGGERIVLVQDYDEHNRYGVDVGPAEFLSRRARLETFSHLAAYQPRDVVIGDDAEAPSVVRAYFATTDFLRMTEVAPLLGRLPDEDDVRPGSEPVVVLPHALWVTLTGSDPGVVGSTLVVGGVRRTVIGVMPADFGFPFGQDLWIPFDAREADGPLLMVGKYREGVSIETARAEMAAVARPDPTRIEDDALITHVVAPLARPRTDRGEVALLAVPILLLTLLLLVMATNVANVILARNAGRTAELAVRGALGAGRPRIVAQLATEVALIVAVAAVLGVQLSRRALSAFEARVELPLWTDLSLEPGAVLFAVALGGLVTLVAGVVPAWRVTSASPGDALRDAGRGTSGVRFGRLTGALIVVQVTICVGFLSAATLLGQSLLSFGFERYGLPAEETLVAQIYFGWPAELNDPDLDLAPEERERIRRTFLEAATEEREAIREGALALPGVRMATYGSRFPGNDPERAWVEIEGVDAPVGRTEVAEIAPGHLALLGAEVVQGRDFTQAEHAGGAPVALVNEPFVRERLGGANAVGRRVRIVPEGGVGPDEQAWATVVGVVPDLGLNPGNPSNAAAVYTPLPDVNVLRLALRGDGDPGAWTPGLIDVARRVDPAVRVQWTRTLEDQMREPVMIFRGLGTGFLVMGLLALLLSAASIHALTACTVTRRTREIGIRQALGAGAGRIVGEVLRRSAIQLAVGTLAGALLALGLVRLSAVLPWEVRSGNAAALGLVVGALTLSGAAALFRPIRRALSIRPADAMRAE